MARNCAVIVGINDYDEISPLKYAKSDAERMRDFFMQDLGVSNDDLYFFSDDSPRNAQGRKTQPTYGTLKSFLGDRFENSFLSAGDTLWFYFSGHGMPCEGRDYLLPSDGNPRSIPDLAIPIGYVTERLRRSGADNVVMLIDACRSDGAKNAGMGIGEEKQQGVITFFSCSPSQVSYEIDDIGQGAFTNVLLEALRIQGEGNCATVERFYQYLRTQVPCLTQRYKNYVQTPYAAIEPATKLHYILLPKFVNLTDIALLREDAFHAEIEQDFALAFQLWMRVNVASGGTDMKAINALIRVGNKRSQSSPQTTVTISDRGSKSPSAPTVSSPVPEVKKNPVEVASGGTDMKASIRWGNQRSQSNPQPTATIDWGSKSPSAPIVSAPVPEVKKNPVELLSAKGIDYRELEKLLKAKEWRSADELTAKLMCQVAGREKVGWLRKEDINQFPCEELRSINQLWVHYSNSKFGFSVQTKLWVECGNGIEKYVYEYKLWKKFAAKVGWYHPQKDDWRTYTEFMDNTKNGQNALPASFPRLVYGKDVIDGDFWLYNCGWGVTSLAQRLVDCNR
jgi:uncharacterized caspase-like protein